MALCVWLIGEVFSSWRTRSLIVTIIRHPTTDCVGAHRQAGIVLRGDEAYLERISFADGDGPTVHVGHHASHAASAYFTSGFDAAVIVTMDGGSMFEPWCTTIYEGRGSDLRPLLQSTSCFTQNYFFTTALLGFTPNKHESKITGLAAHGTLNREILDFFEEHAGIDRSLAHEISTWKDLGEKSRTPMEMGDVAEIRTFFGSGIVFSISVIGSS